MAVDVVMPQMGESVVEGTITRWLVKEGDDVSEDQPLVEISTDKVDTEIPAPAAGVVAKIIAAEGQTIAVGARLAVIENVRGAAAVPVQGSARTAVAEPVVAPRPTAAAAPPAKPQAAAPSTELPAAEPAPAEEKRRPAAEAAGRRFSPVVLRMAAQYQVDLGKVRGSGLGGRVRKRDLLEYLTAQETTGAGSAAAALGRQAPRPGAGRAEEMAAGYAPTPGVAPLIAEPGPSLYRQPLYEPRPGDVVEPFSRRRKLIAEHMVYSKTRAPHVGTVAEVDITRAAGLRQQKRDVFERREGFALTLLPIVAAATVQALREFPRMNASVVGDALVIRSEINLGIAVDTEQGLLVPVIKGAGALSVVELAREIERMRRKVADHSISADDLAGGSFTLSNPGREGNLFGLAIINQPQVGILRMGETKKRPVVVEHNGTDAIAIRTVMYLALSYDHRVIDGVLANRFLYRVSRLLEGAEFPL